MALTKYHAFGLHLTDTLLKLVELVPAGKTYTPIAYGERGLPPGIVVDGIINDPETVSGFINQLKQKLAWGKITTDYVVCSLPESRVFLKAITVPHFPRKQLDEAIAWEARSLIPLPVDQAYFNTQIIEERDKDVDILIAATEKKIVDTYLATLTLAKLTPIALDLECNAAVRTIHEEQIEKSTILAIHIGMKATTLTIFRFGRLLFSNTIPYGIFHLAEEIATTSSTSVEQVLQEIIASGIQPALSDKTTTAIANGIASTISFFHGQVKGPSDKIQRLLVTGSLVGIQGLVDRLKALVVGYELIIASPRIEIEKDLQERGCKPLSASVGLALRGAYPIQFEKEINFLPESFIRSVETHEIQKKSVRLMAILTYIVFLMSIVLGFAYLSIHKELSDIQADNTIAEEVNSGHPAKKLYPVIEETNALVTVLVEIEENRLPVFELLSTINQAVPSRLRFTSLTIDRVTGTIDIKGSAQTREDIVAFVSKLQEGKRFKNIVLSLSSFDKSVEGTFSLTMAFEKHIP